MFPKGGPCEGELLMTTPTSPRHLPRICTAVCLALLLLATRADAVQRNILLIIADDFGVDSFPLTATAGASLPPMPNITALKNSGVLFRNAY